MLHSSAVLAEVLLQNLMAISHFYNIFPENDALLFLFLYVRRVLCSLMKLFASHEFNIIRYSQICHFLN